MPARRWAGTESKTSAVYRKTEMFWGSMAGVERTPATRRHTSRVMEAPEPPAMEEMTRTMGGAATSGTEPAPGTASATRAACSCDRGEAMRARAAWTARETSPSLPSMSRRPMPRNWPAPTVTGKATSRGRRGIQVASRRSPAGEFFRIRSVRAASTTA